MCTITRTLSPTTWSVETILCQGLIFHFMIGPGITHIDMCVHINVNLLCKEITVERSPAPVKRQLIPVLTTGFIHPRW